MFSLWPVCPQWAYVYKYTVTQMCIICSETPVEVQLRTARLVSGLRSHEG